MTFCTPTYLFTFKYLDGYDKATSFYNFEICMFQIVLKHTFSLFAKLVSDQSNQLITLRCWKIQPEYF